MTEILKQGAEARLLLGDFNGERCLIKERFAKKYRHPDLDASLTKERMRAEAKAASRCQAAGIRVPKVIHMDLNSRRIYMEYFEKSITVKDYINSIVVTNDATKQDRLLLDLGNRIGAVIGTLHANNIIHGDLTTSNMLIDPRGKYDNPFDKYELITIDFGLASYGQSAEQKGVDLYVLERALLSTHSTVPNLFSTILDTYQENNVKSSKEVISKFEDVRARGRKRTMIG